jgi:N-acetylmuramoyl-L-alanine amidase
MYVIKDHKLVGARYNPSPNTSGPIIPLFLVMHYTASWTAESAINVLTRKGSGVSAHFVVDLDGTVTQLLPCNAKGWHAGPSVFSGYSGLNSNSIGIEIVNIGYLKKVGDGRFMDHTGQVLIEGQGRLKGVELFEAKHVRVGSGTYYWPCYPKAQLDAVEKLTQALCDSYGLIDVVSHEEIDMRGWKTDPGPSFPMERFKRIAQNRALDEMTYEVIATTLNVRQGPGTNYPATITLSRGTRIAAEDRRGDWVRIGDNDWVHGAFLKRIQ